MNRFLVKGGKSVYGEVEIQSGKNCLLPAIAACVMLETEVCFHKCPKLTDILTILEIIKYLGGKYRFENDDLYVDCSSLYQYELPVDLTSKIRASIFLLGPLLARFKKAIVFEPGGCNIGKRPIDIHIEGLKNLGTEISIKDYIYCRLYKPQGSEIRLNYRSVGATENLIMCATKIKGITKIKNCAKEPEIIFLQNFLNSYGCKISGAGTDEIVIEGISEFSKDKLDFFPYSDRIECGTFILMTLVTKGELLIKNVNYKHNQMLLKKIQNNTCKLYLDNDKIYIKANDNFSPLGLINTNPYPGFPTDLQSQVLAYSSILEGITVISENVFDNRFNQVYELNKMGANIKLDKNVAFVTGVKKLTGCHVNSFDLRGGAAMIIAGIVADGLTTIYDNGYIDRGYYKLIDKLRKINIDIIRE